eukprot:TRINITY_DN54507_c0_g2_i1.p1 TRINITY_DN54507_c0_g2~~TRINITY_DN54507_c0_g2_i1.p1  ORF type:complete len:661 (+),score=9.62 TRINITY_DN54507_c0_g2_i1:240-1985(+)
MAMLFEREATGLLEQLTQAELLHSDVPEKKKRGRYGSIESNSTTRSHESAQTQREGEELSPVPPSSRPSTAPVQRLTVRRLPRGQKRLHSPALEFPYKSEIQLYEERVLKEATNPEKIQELNARLQAYEAKMNQPTVEGYHTNFIHNNMKGTDAIVRRQGSAKVRRQHKQEHADEVRERWLSNCREDRVTQALLWRQQRIKMANAAAERNPQIKRAREWQRVLACCLWGARAYRELTRPEYIKMKRFRARRAVRIIETLFYPFIKRTYILRRIKARFVLDRFFGRVIVHFREKWDIRNRQLKAHSINIMRHWLKSVLQKNQFLFRIRGFKAIVIKLQRCWRGYLTRKVFRFGIIELQWRRMENSLLLSTPYSETPVPPPFEDSSATSAKLSRLPSSPVLNQQGKHKQQVLQKHGSKLTKNPSRVGFLRPHTIATLLPHINDHELDGTPCPGIGKRVSVSFDSVKTTSVEICKVSHTCRRTLIEQDLKRRTLEYYEAHKWASYQSRFIRRRSLGGAPQTLPHFHLILPESYIFKLVLRGMHTMHVEKVMPPTPKAKVPTATQAPFNRKKSVSAKQFALLAKK